MRCLHPAPRPVALFKRGPLYFLLAAEMPEREAPSVHAPLLQQGQNQEGCRGHCWGEPGETPSVGVPYPVPMTGMHQGGVSAHSWVSHQHSSFAAGPGK